MNFSIKQFIVDFLKHLAYTRGVTNICYVLQCLTGPW
nr:MAG TPA: hypothetical protein [Caudoviricetes sp.]